jgi:hypothetical protein
MKVPAYQLALQAQQAHQADPAARFVLLRLAADAFDEAAVDINAEPWPVVVCTSPLAVREAMRRYAAGATPAVLLFAGTEEDLGHDVLARCAKRRLFAHDLWQTVLALFRAASLDPRLTRQRWLAELLLRFLPPEGYLPVRSLALDQERVWQELFQVVLGFTVYPPTAPDLLAWASTPRLRERFETLPVEAQTGIGGHFQERLGDVGGVVLAAIAAGQADDLLAAGLLCEALDDREPTLTAATAKITARLEILFGGISLSARTLQHWASAARDGFERATGNDRQPPLSRYEALVARLKAEPLAVRARYGQAALAEKIRSFAGALNESDGSSARRWLTGLLAHQGPTLDERVVLRCQMAVRLIGWLAQPTDGATPSLTALATRYRHDLAWVDWARNVLLEGDDSAELAGAYARLRDCVRQRREAFDRSFAEALATGVPDGAALIPIEEALARTVVPVAAAGRILLIVVDGMSIAVFLELHQSLKQHGWSQCQRTPGTGATLLAMLPSTTEASRTSLFCGRPCTGSAATEHAEFKRFPALVAPSVAGKPPLLFHKKDLLDRSGIALADDLRAALNDTRQRVVAVVINAVDDHLMKADQLRLRWTIAQFKGLDALLAEARSSERTVILSSDHGHLLDQDTELRASSPNARWREPSLESYPGESKLGGARVKAACGLDEVVLAWNERLRYASKRNGYHGGCSPQEALVPVASYRHGPRMDDGWYGSDEAPPAWWRINSEK